MKPKSPKIAEDLFQELQRQILSGALEPGTRLPPERKLASTYGTNRNTLREAIRRLEQAGLVSVRHGQGVTVLDFRAVGTIELLEPWLLYATNPHEKVAAFTDLLAARTRVLEHALELAMERATADDLQLLDRAADRLLELSAAGAQDQLAEAYADWLDLLIDASHSLPARWLANPMLDLNDRFNRRFPGMWVMDESFPDTVRALSRALHERDLPAAIAANRAYYSRVDTQVLTLLGWVIQSGMVSWDAEREAAEVEGRRQRREARIAAARSPQDPLEPTAPDADA